MSLLIKVTFFACVVAMLVLRGGARRFYYKIQWKIRERPGFKYEFGQVFYRGRTLSGFVLRFAAPSGVRLLVRRETWFDQLGKILRIAIEPQVGDPDFDSRFYIDCEDPELVALLQTRLGLRNLLRRLEIGMRARDAVLRELRWENARLEVAIDSASVSAESSRESEALEWLQPLVEALRSLPAKFDKPIDRARLPRWGYVAVWLVGTIGCTVVGQFFSDRLIDAQGLVRWSMPYSLAMFAVFVVWVLIRLGPVPRRHRVLAECVAVGLPGFLLCGILVARAVDLDLDNGAVERLPVSRASLYTRSGNYRLSFHAEDRRIWTTTPLSLSEDDYDRLHPLWPTGNEKREMSLLLHPGALGFPWVELQQ